MVPDKSSSCWRQILTGKKALQTQTLALQMLLKRLQRNITPTTSEADIGIAIGELHAFFTKYQNMLSTEIQSL
ncbi:MAG: hypothetical protein HY014_10805 [Acidobacteria bacterium]|nr:hypothetical protein [Acidobacteriota bacterium]MBI3488644.1 hypothetical protein [Acidobacteriota bacterium]